MISYGRNFLGSFVAGMRGKGGGGGGSVRPWVGSSEQIFRSERSFGFSMHCGYPRTFAYLRGRQGDTRDPEDGQKEGASSHVTGQMTELGAWLIISGLPPVTSDTSLSKKRKWQPIWW